MGKGKGKEEDKVIKVDPEGNIITKVVVGVGVVIEKDNRFTNLPWWRTHGLPSRIISFRMDFSPQKSQPNPSSHL
jgi:hypothetical protein